MLNELPIFFARLRVAEAIALCLTSTWSIIMLVMPISTMAEQPQSEKGTSINSYLTPDSRFDIDAVNRVILGQSDSQAIE